MTKSISELVKDQTYVRNVLTTLQNHLSCNSKRGRMFSWQIIDDLEERGSFITQGNHLSEKVETALYTLQNAGRVKRNLDGSYSLEDN